MIKFESAQLIGDLPMRLIPKRTNDGRTLSLIFEGTACRDRGDRQQRMASLSFDVDVALDGGPPEPMAIDIRGVEDRSDASGFAVLRLQVTGASHRFTAHDANGRIDARVLTTPSGNVVRLSMLMLAQAGLSPTNETLLTVETIDLTWVADHGSSPAKPA